MEYTFVPTRERPEHEHEAFQETMRWYYPFLPRYPHRLNLWRRQPGPVDLVSSGGHCVRFPGVRMYPLAFPMRHYLFLSRRHAVEKYVERGYDPRELARGWHRARSRLRPEAVRLLPQAALRT